ncbi:NAD(P)H nitroreductase [Mycobacterium sp. IDR2000157661]|nr:NAD(P)H nitroreductase [Mycobacterium sp. IDR2000157661]
MLDQSGLADVSKSAEFPDAQTIRTALTLATRAPSIHNSQPWRWMVGERSLHLYADPTHHLIHADPDRRELMVSCGLVLNHAVIALSALGWRARVSRFPNPAEPSHLASVLLSSSPADHHDVALAAAIPRRRTDRRHFSPWPVPRGDVATIGARTARMGIQLRCVEMSRDISGIVAEAVSRHDHDSGYRAELSAWSGRRAATTGVPARNIPAPATASLLGRRFAAGVMNSPGDAAAGEDHAALLALGSAADDDLARLRAGEATSMALLTATSFGLATCPVSEPLEIGETRDAIMAEVFDNREYPQMMFRIGWAPVGADPLPSTPRRPIDEVVTDLDGTPLQ